jgi:uncharacterized repeat protein (TIGR01451 family)
MNRTTHVISRAWRAFVTLALVSAAWLLPAAHPVHALDIPLTAVTALSVGNDHVCALLADNDVTCWGSNKYEQLGSGVGQPDAQLPQAIASLNGDVVRIGGGDWTTCAVLSSNAVRCWGNHPLPLRDIIGTPPNQTQNNYEFSGHATPAAIDGLAGADDVLHISAGAYHGCALLRNTSSGNRFAVCWGSNEMGQLGNSTTPMGNDALDFEGPRKSVELPPMTPVKLDAGDNHTCALAELGHAACWGSGVYGQIGDGHNSNRPTGTLVDGIDHAAVDIASGANHTCVVIQDGRVQCWGLNSRGQLGDASVGNRNSATYAAIVNATQIAAGSAHTCAVTRQHTVLCWGSNYAGQLGDGGNQNSLTPQRVPDLDDAAQVFAGGDQTCALLLDSSVACWGNSITRPAIVIRAQRDILVDEHDIDFGDTFSDVPNVPDQPFEYGDAPDGGIPAYPGVPGHFPVLGGNSANGPKHANPSLFKLGEATSTDAPVDADGLPNIDTTAQIANLDLGDDGWLNARDITRLDACQTLTLRVRVRRGAGAPADVPLYLNAWLDGNRDGDWQDTRTCQGGSGYEWIVQNHTVQFGSSASIGTIVIDVPTRRILSSAPTAPAWLRLTLGDRPAITPTNASAALPDGRGLSSGYFGYGETEDYLWDPLTPREQYGEWDVRKSVGTNGPVMIGSTLNYTIEVRRADGSQASVAATLVDVLPPQTSFVSGVTVQQLAPTVSPAAAVFEANRGGPSGRVRWIGSLGAGAQFRLRYSVRVDACTTIPIDNTAYVIVPGSGQVLSNTISTALACTPPPSPSFTLNKQIVDAIGSTGLSVGAQLSETVYLLTLNQNNLSQNLAAVIQDGLPLGLATVQVQASRGLISTTNADRTVNWMGVLGSTLPPLQIWIRARVTGSAQCRRETINTAQFAVRNADGTLTTGTSNALTFTPGCTPPELDGGQEPGEATPAPTATAMPSATITPTPRPTNTSVPRATNTSVPRPTNTSEPVETYTPVPRPTNTPVPAPTNTPVPLGPDNPPGAPTNTPVPRATNTSVPAEPYTPVPRPTNTSVPVATYTPVPVETYTPVPLPEVLPPGSVRVLLPLVSR